MWKHPKKIVYMLLFGCMRIISPYPLHNDREAYRFCELEKQSFIAIVWPIAQGNDQAIEKILHSIGSIKYKKKVYLNWSKAFCLLKKAHPHMSNMKEHVAWYFPPGTLKKPARIYVVTFQNLASAITCKYAVRRLFTLHYRSIHINDTHEETLDLANYFFKFMK